MAPVTREVTAGGVEVTPPDQMSPYDEASDELRRVREQHKHHYLRVVESITPDGRSDDQIVDELGNIRRALRWCVRSGDWDSGQRFCAALAPFWSRRRMFREAHEWCDDVLSVPGAPPLHEARARLLYAALLWQSGRYQDAVREAETSKMIGLAEVDEEFVVEARCAVGWYRYYAGVDDVTDLIAEFRAAVESDAPVSDNVRSTALQGCAWMLMRAGDLESAKTLYEEALEIAPRLGPAAVAGTFAVYGNLLKNAGDHQGALEAGLRELEGREEVGTIDGIISALVGVADSATRIGDEDLAASSLARASALTEHPDASPWAVAWTMLHVAKVARAAGDVDAARRHAARGAGAMRGRELAEDERWSVTALHRLLAAIAYGDDRRLEAAEHLVDVVSVLDTHEQSDRFTSMQEMLDAMQVARHHRDDRGALAVAVAAERVVTPWNDVTVLHYIRSRAAELRGGSAQRLDELDAALAAVDRRDLKWSSWLHFEAALAHVDHGDPQRARELLDATLAMVTDAGMRVSQARVLVALASLARRQGRMDEHRALAADVLALEPANAAPFVEAAEELALAAAEADDLETAVRLAASAAAERGRSESPPRPAVQRAIDAVLADARHALDPPTFDSLWDQGSQVSPKDALET